MFLLFAVCVYKQYIVYLFFCTLSTIFLLLLCCYVFMSNFLLASVISARLKSLTVVIGECFYFSVMRVNTNVDGDGDLNLRCVCIRFIAFFPAKTKQLAL